MIKSSVLDAIKQGVERINPHHDLQAFIEQQTDQVIKIKNLDQKITNSESSG